MTTNPKSKKTIELRPETKEERQKRHELHQIHLGKTKARDIAKKHFGRMGGVDWDPNSPPEVRCRVGRLVHHQLRGGKRWTTLTVRGTGPDWFAAFRDADRMQQDDQRRSQEREKAKQDRQKQQNEERKAS